MSTEKQTFTFKTVSDNHGNQTPVQLDLHLPTEATSHGNQLKVILWFHGGGLVQGNRATCPQHFLEAPNKYGVAFISADYRLAPQVRLPEIQDDIADCLSFIIHSLPSQLSSPYKLNVSEIAVSGGSAGGYLAFLLGLGMTKLPSSDLSHIKAMVPIYPITDLGTSFFTSPSQPFKFGEQGPGGYNADPEAPEKFKEFLDPTSKVVTNSSTTPYRNLLYFWAQEKALFPELVYSKEQRDKGLMKTTSVTGFIENNKGKKDSWAPIFMIHGDKDMAVDVEQAREVEKSLKGIGFNELIYEERKGTDHLFDMKGDEMSNMWNFISDKLSLSK